MTVYTVRTQAELDEAVEKAGYRDTIEIRSERGVWLQLKTKTDATVRASGTATVRASGTATVRASGTATVRASGTATVRASGTATVRASGTATVRASGTATVRASGTATVRASGTATVRASGTATVEAWGTATVRASGTATVRASGTATVRGYHRAKIKATPHVAVHLHSARVEVDGGVVIDVTQLGSSAESWLEHHGIEILSGQAVLFKAVGDNLRSGWGFEYPIGETVSCVDWRDQDSCGNGLHLSPRPVHAKSYHESATRFLACRVDVAGVRVLTGGGAPKIKVRELTVLHEVDIDGEPLDVTAADEAGGVA